MNKMNKKGFTLIEMLVVIAIIAVLVAIIVPVVGNSTAKAKAAADAANLRSVAATAAIDYLDNNELNVTPDNPGCESLTGTTTLEIWNENGAINAYYVNGGKYYGVNEFSKTANDGSTLTGVSAPTGTGVGKLEVKTQQPAG